MPKGEYLQYGGQAVVEGVMMRSPKHFAVAVRAPNGQIVLQTEPLAKSWVGRQKWLRLPFLRGTLALLDAMGLGIKAMTFASNVQMEEKYQPETPQTPEHHAPEADSVSREGSGIVEPTKHGGESIKKIAVGLAMFSGLALALFLFVFLPNLLGEQLRRVGVTNSTQLNFYSGLLKFVLFIGYVYLISRMKDVQRVFQYHGAEHKAINTLEALQDLSMDNCRKQTRLHPRCGTSFAIIVLILDVIVMTFINRYPLGYQEAHLLVNLFMRFLINLAVLPAVAGVSYELIRLAGKFRHSGIVMALFAPGLATQLLTTSEPEEDQIEVALVALRAVLEAEEVDVRAPEPAIEPAATL